MNVIISNQATGQTKTVDVGNVTEIEMRACLDTKTSERTLKDRLDNLNLPGEVKAMLWNLRQFVIRIGKRVLHVGRKILEVMLLLVPNYPTATIGLIVGLICWYLVNRIPLIGDFIGASITGIAMLLGIARDAWDRSPEQASRLKRELDTIFGTVAA